MQHQTRHRPDHIQLSQGRTLPTTPRATQATDVGQFHAQLDRELADNAAYEVLNEQWEAEGFTDTDEFGVAYIGQAYCGAPLRMAVPKAH
jgi:hypothetical protein